MFKFPKELEGHYVSILVHGISTFEIKVTSVTDDEVIGTYSDGEEVHIRQEAVLVYWPDRAKALREKERSKKSKEMWAKKKLEKAQKWPEYG